MGEPLRADLEGPAFDEEWELVNCWNAYVFGSEFKTWYCICSVPEATRFSLNPKNRHALAINHILRYPMKTQDKCVYMHPDGSYKLSCYVDLEFGGIFESKDSGYLLLVD